jgi:N-acetylglucosamine kinase-like BadF-type ATPase
MNEPLDKSVEEPQFQGVGEIESLVKQLGESYAAKRLAMLARCAWQALAERDAAAKKLVDMQAAQGFQEKRADRLQAHLNEIVEAYNRMDVAFQALLLAGGVARASEDAKTERAASQEALRKLVEEVPRLPTGKPEGPPYTED